MRDRVARIQAVLREIGADWAVLTSPDSVCYATGHVVPVEAGPSPFSGGPTTAVVSKDGVVGLIGPNHEFGKAPTVDAFTNYTGFTLDEPTDQVESYRRAVTDVTHTLGIAGRLGIERASFPHTLSQIWNLPTCSIDRALARGRAVKTSGELALLKRAAEIAAIGQEAARALSVVDTSELEIFSGVRSAMERAAGVRCPVTGDFLSGVARTAAMAGGPIERMMQVGDPVICDLAPRIEGFWGDSCGSFCLGQPTERYLGMFSAARAALEAAEAEIRPGLSVSSLDAFLRDVVNSRGFDYPHHSGHSIGASVHEYPRIVPREAAIIEENMVLMIEPGAYVPEIGGVRLEWMFKVNSTGAQTMAKFPLSAVRP